MTTSIVQASCAVDVVVCDDTGTTFTPLWINPLGVAVVFLVLVALVLVIAERRRR